MLALSSVSIPCCFGDSLVERDSFWDLRTSFRQHYPTATRFVFFKDGIGGTTTLNGTTRFSAISTRYPFPTAYIIEYGTNDFGAGAGGLAAFTTNYGTLVDQAVTAAGAGNIICVGIMGASDSAQPNLTSYNAVISAKAIAVGATYVDLQTIYQTMLTAGDPDPCQGPGQVHPTDVTQTWTKGTSGSPQGAMTGKQWYSRAVSAYVSFA
jgi:hypothetical protein